MAEPAVIKPDYCIPVYNHEEVVKMGRHEIRYRIHTRAALDASGYRAVEYHSPIDITWKELSRIAGELRGIPAP